MVFFTCNHCGESIKKPSVEKHYITKCRGAVKSLSCMDCHKDFHAEEYVVHTKCISEAKKYSGKDYVEKESKNKGAKKQETWTDIVRSILDARNYNLSAQTRNIFQRLQTFGNVPRKKAKFQNFVANSMRVPISQAEPVWAVLEKELEKMKQSKGGQGSTAGPGGQQHGNSQAAEEEQPAVEEVAAKKKKQKKDRRQCESNGAAEEMDGHEEVPVKKKKKLEAEMEVEGENGVAEAGVEEESHPEEFQWSVVLEKAVTKRMEGIKLEKLKKKVLKKYKAKLALEELTEKQQKKFEKKFTKYLNKSPAIQVDGDLIKPR